MTNADSGKEINSLIDEYNILDRKAEKTYNGSYPPEIAILMFIAKALTIIAKKD